MAENAELAFVKSHLNILSSLPVTFPNDFQQPPHQSSKVPALPVEVPPPPVPESHTDAAASSATISITFKSLKPPRTFTIDKVDPSDSIKSIKELLASQPGAPPASYQSLLLKGKALADGKLLQEYAVKGGDSITVMIKHGMTWDWNAPAPPARDADGDVSMSLEPDSALKSYSSSLNTSPALSRSTSGAIPRHSHSRIPSVVLSPSPSMTDLDQESPAPIVLNLDTTNIPSGNDLKYSTDSYRQTISTPVFWERLYLFLKAQFDTQDDAIRAFEDFLIGAKGSLTPHEIAKIRDSTGLTGMAGT